MVNQLPRQLNDDYALNVHIKRHLIHKSSYLKGYVQKGVVKQWLTYLLNTPLYKRYNIKVDESFLNISDPTEEQIKIEPMTDQNDQENELLLAQQQTLLWNEDKYLCLAPAQKETPLSLIFDEHAEELSFPNIYLGQPRQFKNNVKVSPFMMATSEIRRKDRRGVTPQHVLYMAMKILRLRLTQGMFSTFKCTGDTSKITKKMIEDKQFLEQCIERNLSFLKSIPNSVHYWALRKKDVFAMIRQLGKPTMFLTLSSSEIKWPDLLKLLYKLKLGKELEGDPFVKLSSYDRCTLVTEDPVTCVIYFNKLVDVIMNILMSPTHSPFGKYRVIDFFKRIEFQHRGSAHAHILLWLDNDPKEPIDENMPETINLIDHLCSLSHENLEFRSSQIHRHTFTCYKKNDKQCRFNAPFWPMDKTRILIPMSKEDGRRKAYTNKFKSLKQHLEEQCYDSFENFLSENKISNIDEYLNIIRSGIKRPTVLMQRTTNQIWVNSFNHWLAKIIRSNMDLQFILEEYSCASYVVEYVNKTNRGISNLQRELLKLREEYPDKDYKEMLSELSIKMLNTVEMSSQEAAWYLLRQPMSEASRKIEYIPTVWPHERQKVKKTVKEMEKIGDESTDIWKDTVIYKYENRPNDLENVTLADFVSKYYKTNDHEYKLHANPKVIRFKHYEMNDLSNYKREMVLLFVPFRNEEVDILDNNTFLQIYEDKEQIILERKKEYESNMDIEKTMEICKQLCIELDDESDSKQQLEEYVKGQQIKKD